MVFCHMVVALVLLGHDTSACRMLPGVCFACGSQACSLTVISNYKQRIILMLHQLITLVPAQGAAFMSANRLCHKAMSAVCLRVVLRWNVTCINNQQPAVVGLRMPRHDVCYVSQSGVAANIRHQGVQEQSSV